MELLFQIKVFSLTTMIFFLKSMLIIRPSALDIPSSNAKVTVEHRRMEKAIRMIPPILTRVFTIVPPFRK
jgi:hypothetical protein